MLHSKQNRIFYGIVLLVIIFCYSQNSVAQIIGPVKGIWTPDKNPYYIVGDIWVSPGDTLIIKPGVEVFFLGTYYFEIKGLLQALGTADNMITFHGGGAKGSWRGIYFPESATNGCILDYCIIKDAGFENWSAIYIENNEYRVTISNSEIFNCKCKSIYIISWFTTHGGDNITKKCRPLIANNSIHDNGNDGIYVYAYYKNTDINGNNNTSIAAPKIKYNLIYSNGGAGIKCYTYANGSSSGWGNNDDTNPTIQANPKIQQNTIYGNGACGIDCSKTINEYFDGTVIIEANPLITSNIISNNGEYGLNANNTVSCEKVKFNDFWKNKSSNFSGIGCDLGKIVKRNLNGDPCDFNWNIYSDPEFVDALHFDFRLRCTSPCIDAGDLSLPFDPNGSRPDIGAIYYPGPKPALPYPDNFTVDKGWISSHPADIHWSDSSGGVLAWHANRRIDQDCFMPIKPHSGNFELAVKHKVNNKTSNCWIEMGLVSDYDGSPTDSAAPTSGITLNVGWTGAGTPFSVFYIQPTVRYADGTAWSPYLGEIKPGGSGPDLNGYIPYELNHWYKSVLTVFRDYLILKVYDESDVLVGERVWKCNKLSCKYQYIYVGNSDTKDSPTMAGLIDDLVVTNQVSAALAKAAIADAATAMPLEFRLSQNYPNPFNPETGIHYQLASSSNVKLEIYNMLGQKVRMLVNAHQNTGEYQVKWDGCDETGAAVSGGVYLYRLTAGEFVATRKMLLIR